MTNPVKFAVTTRERIAGVKVKPLRVVPDERGWLMEILRADDGALPYDWSGRDG